MLTRSIGAALRGKATRTQVFLAAFLAGLLGFVPGFFLPGDLGGGFRQAPGLILTLLFLVLVLNANLGMFGLCLLCAKLLSLPLLSVSFKIGEFLLEGPLQGLYRWLINAPVTAWFGLEYYATAGGLVLGAVFGLVVGWLLARSITAIRTHMANVEEKSERYQKWSKKKSVRLLAWAFLGKGKGKKTWKELTEQKRGLPVRIVGIVIVLVLAVGLWFVQPYLSTPVLTSGTKSGLMTANGATVDLGEARLDLAGGQLLLKGLAIADSKQLDTDVFRAATLEAKIDTVALLQKRLVIERLTASSASSGEKRASPGVLVPQPAQPPAPPADPDAKSLDDYLDDARVWKDRLDQARAWLEKLKGDGKATPPPTKAEIEAQRQEVGDAKVAATHLLDKAPFVLIKSIDIGGITIAALGGKVDLVGSNLSTDPALVQDTLSLQMKSKDTDRLLLKLAGPAGGNGPLGFEFAMKGLSVDSFFSQVKLSGTSPLSGGTMDIASSGEFDKLAGQAATIKLPLQVTLVGSTFAFPGMQPTVVDSLLLPVGVRGAITSPSITLDDKALGDALAKAGKAELANFVNAQAGKLLGGKIPGVENLVDPTRSVGENADALKQKAEEEAARQAAALKAKAEAEAKKQQDALKAKALEEAQKGLKGLLPGGKKK